MVEPDLEAIPVPEGAYGPPRLPRAMPRLAVAIVVLFIAGAAAAGTLSAPPSRAARATNALRAAQHFARRATTVRFTSQARYDIAPDNQGFGTTESMSLNGAGAVRFPDRFRMLEHTSDRAAETIVVGSALYHREGDDAASIATRKWIDVSALLRAGGGDNGTGGAVPEVIRPSALVAMIEAAREPLFVARKAHVTTIHTRIQAGAYSVDGHVLDTTELELRVHDGGEIEGMVVRFQSDALRGATAYTFRSWARPVTIVAPPAALIDATPTIDEEALAVFTAAPLLAPRAIPAGWVVDNEGVLGPDETVEGCQQVELDYVDPTTPDQTGYLTLFELPASCKTHGPPDGARPFVIGRGRGWIASTPDGEVDAQFAIGATVIQAETDLSPRDLATVLRNLVPLDPAHPPAANLPAGGGTTS